MPIDTSLAKAPPRKRAATPVGRNSTPVVETPSLNQKRVEGLNGVASLAQGGLMVFGQFADAAAIGQLFGPVAKELANIADSSDAIAKPIDFLIEVGPYGALVAAVLPLALQLAANHKLVNANMLAGQGVVPPEVLDAQMRAQMTKMQADAMRAQQQAIRDAQQAQQDYERLMNQE